MTRFSDPQRLEKSHSVGGFDCGVESLNFWLERHAKDAGAVGSARTFVVLDTHSGDRVVGFYALAVASVTHGEATTRTAMGMPKHDIPAVLLARLAVDEAVKGNGIGAFLVRDAMQRVLAVSESAGVRLMLVHALDENAQQFYKRFGFEPSPTDSLNLQLIIKDIKASLEAVAKS